MVEFVCGPARVVGKEEKDVATRFIDRVIVGRAGQDTVTCFTVAPCNGRVCCMVHFPGRLCGSSNALIDLFVVVVGLAV